MNGPNENAKQNRSAGTIFMMANFCRQQFSIQSHDSGVSSQRNGRPVDVPEV